MNIYEEVVEKVREGSVFHIDFKKRNLRLGKRRYVIKNGVWDKGKELIGNIQLLENPLDTIEKLYSEYKYSLPSAVSESKKGKRYFKALNDTELSDEQMINGEYREVAQIKLEAFILIAILNGWKWKEEYGKWFYQGKDRDLIILREWVEEKVNEFK